MKVTFADFGPQIASSRLRAAIPQKELAKYGIKPGLDILVYGKHVIDFSMTKQFKMKVFDICDDHYSSPFSDYYFNHTERADLVTCNSETMKQIIRDKTGRGAIVIPDPYESVEVPAGIGRGYFWFGHQSNMPTLEPYRDLNIKMLTGEAWSRERQLDELNRCAAVICPTDHRRAKSANRLIETVRNGRFFIGGDLPSYDEFKPWMWIGDIRDGVKWFESHQDEIKDRITECQNYIRTKYSPETIGKLWLKTLENAWQSPHTAR